MTITPGQITVCTTYYGRGAKTPVVLRTAKMFGIRLRRFGTARHFTTFLETKVIPLYEFVKKVKTPYVMFVDGNDVMFTTGLAPLCATWLNMCGGEPRLTVGSERHCWPFREHREPLCERARQAGSKSPHRYMDLGLLMGPTGEVAVALKTIIDSVPECSRRARKVRPGITKELLEDDLGLWGWNVIDGSVDPLIDYGCRLLVSLKDAPTGAYDRRKGRLHYKPTDSWPHLVHCNGHRVYDRKRLKWVYNALFGGSPAEIMKTQQVKL